MFDGSLDVSDAEIQALRAEAARLGLSFSDYLRTVVSGS